MSTYRTAPEAQGTMPKGIPYIISNEAAERFSYYGMRAILTIFLTKHLVDSLGRPDFMGEEEAAVWYHLFGVGVYAFPVLGALLSDALIGKYRTILALSSVYCVGHGVLALADTELGRAIMEPRTGFAVGLCLIAVGSGGIKPCVSAHVGDQFGPKNKHLLTEVFRWFYFSINLGAMASQLMMGPLLDQFGPQLAFGIPGILMFVATVVFWLGRNTFVHIPAGGRGFLLEVFSKEGVATLLRLGTLYVFIATFWALFDQSGSSWVLQAEKMDRRLFGLEFLSSQLQAANPLLVMLLIPLFGFVIYPAVERVFRFTPLRRIGVGLFLTVPAFLIPAYVESQIEAGGTPTIAWQLLAYVLITAAEVMVSITALEFSYTQAPKQMKSVVMATYMLSIALGNFVTAGTNWAIRNPEPHFMPNETGSYTVRLSATDGTATSTSDVAIEVIDAKPEDRVAPPDEPPSISVRAGRDRAVAPGKPVTLFAVAKGVDRPFPWSPQTAYRWTLRSKPDASTLTVGAVGSDPSITFVPDASGEYTLVAMAQHSGQQSEDEVTVFATRENISPTAVATTSKPGPFVLSDIQDTGIRLDGTDSYDPNPHDTIRYRWSIVTGGGAKGATISAPTFPGVTSKLHGAAYFLFFAGLMLLTALLFIPVAASYRGRTYIQGE